MKRVICILIALSLLLGCGQRNLTPRQETQAHTTAPTIAATPTATYTAEPTTPTPTATPRPALATYAPVDGQTVCFPEELLSQDGEPVVSLIHGLLADQTLTKADFFARFQAIIDRVDALHKGLLALSDEGRTLTADRKEKTIDALKRFMEQDMLDALQTAYEACPGEGAGLPLTAYADALAALLQDILGMEERTVAFFELGPEAARDYLAALGRYMGESVAPRDLFDALEDLTQTEAYAVGTALKADPEAARKKEPISFGSYAQNMDFLCRVTEELCPLPDGSSLPQPVVREGAEDMDLMTLAFHYYPGMAFLNAYAAHSAETQQARWANAPDGYLAGLAVHNSYVVVPYLSDFGLDYVQYRWYEDMLTVTLTGLSALLIHYYGYSPTELKEYLKSWGAEDFSDYLYAKAMSDPFEGLVASYGYYRYLDICQAALDGGCPSEEQFLRDYLAAGPAPFEALKEYMVSFYRNRG